MYKTTFIICHIIITLLISNVCYPQRANTPDQNTPQNLISTPDKAKEKALKYLGFEKMEGFSADSNFDMTSLVVLNDDKTPFLHNKINNREIWKIMFRILSWLEKLVVKILYSFTSQQTL